MKKTSLVVLLSAMFAAPAFADDLYLGAKMGQANYGYANVANNSQLGVGFLGGMAINQNIALEAEYNTLGGFDSPTGNIKGSALSMSGLGFLPLNRQVSLFGKLGVAVTTLNDTAKPGFVGNFSYTSTAITYGLGAQFYMSRELSIRAGYDSYSVGTAASGTNTAGELYLAALLHFN